MDIKKKVSYDQRRKQRDASKKYYQKNANKIKEKRKAKFLEDEKKRADAFRLIIQEKIKNGDKNI